MNCPRCGSERSQSRGWVKGRNKRQCSDCKKWFTSAEEHRGNFVEKDALTVKIDEQTTPMELLEKCGFDSERVEITPMANNWGNTQKQSLSFRWRIKDEYKNKTLLETIKDLDIKPVKTRYKKRDLTDVASIITFTDLHLDKMRFLQNGVIVNEIQKNRKHVIETFIKAIEYAESNASNTVFLPIIGDWFHTNNHRGTTKGNTPQDTSVPERIAFDVIMRLMIEMIETLRSEGFYVRLQVVRGNHDEDTMFKAMTMLDIYYSECEDVEYTINHFARQYTNWGKTLLMFAHGDHEKKKIQNIVGIIAQENRKLWAECDSTLCIFGDVHHTNEWAMKQTQKDHMSVLVKFLRSFDAPDKWHHDSQYIGVPKTGYVHLVHRQHGYIGERLFNFY